MKYILLNDRFEHKAGTIVFKATSHDYGLARDDTNYSNKEFIMQAWDVFLLGHFVDTVFFVQSCDELYVLNSLINHDGFDNRINIEKA